MHGCDTHFECLIKISFFFCFFKIYVATLTEWNVAVYGTKDSPESKLRAAISLPSSTVAPTTTVQPTPKTSEEAIRQHQPPSTAGGEWLDKTTIHQNNLEQNARASFLPNDGQPLEPVPVLSSSGGAGVRCRPGHWDSASAVCLSTCLALVIALLVSDDRYLISTSRLFR